jgi:DNA mismatch repair protein MutS
VTPRSDRIIARSPTRPPGAQGDDTPMMEQFRRAKKEAPDALLFFRMGDFYELFHEDAVTAARELGLTLTSRSKGSPQPIPMAGVPVRSVEGHLVRLVKKGHKVAICEQLQDPREAKGIVERGIVRVVTPGTLTEENALDARASNHLASLVVHGGRAGLAWIDLSTGRLSACEVDELRVLDELARVAPVELLHAPELLRERASWRIELKDHLGTALTERESWRFAQEGSLRTLTRHFRVQGLGGFGIEPESLMVPAAGALLEYVAETQKAACEHILRIEPVQPESFLLLDRATRRCLELVETQREHRREGSLLEILDGTLTPMGARALREWLLHPLRDVAAIRTRQGGVSELVASGTAREDLREALESVHDVERLCARISTGRANGRDLVALGNSLIVLPRLRASLAGCRAPALQAVLAALDPLDDVCARIRAALVDEPPLTVKEGGLIRRGFAADLDELHQIAGDAKSWMARFQAEESARSGLPGLKIGFNSVFGYYIEVPRGQVERVPPNYIRKQTVKAAERYVTPELKEFEDKVLNAESLSVEREYELFQELRLAVAAELSRVLGTARALAELDALAALAHVAAAYRYVAPEIDDGEEIRIVEGRHPVIERSTSCQSFVPNDAHLDSTTRRLTILTGPNMAGKSTYIRQVALIVLLAQCGAFVPAKEARIGLVDRVFTRVGSADDLSRGQSTFMVEMTETANILNHATRRSLVILDEVGRGTSTFDGLALAWAIAEHVHERIGCRTLFATHYHQLTDLASRYTGTVNRTVAVREWGDEIVFLHKIVEGGTDRSYGIHVARLAGVPGEVLARARAILGDLEHEEVGLAQRILARAPPAAGTPVQLGLFSTRSPVEEELLALDLDRLSPLDALLALRALRDRVR